MPSKQTAYGTVHLSERQGILSQSTPLPGILTVESAVRAPQECGRILHPKLTYFVYVLKRVDASHEVESVMVGVVSTDIALGGAFLN